MPLPGLDVSALTECAARLYCWPSLIAVIRRRAVDLFPVCARERRSRDVAATWATEFAFCSFRGGDALNSKLAPM